MASLRFCAREALVAVLEVLRVIPLISLVSLSLPPWGSYDGMNFLKIFCVTESSDGSCGIVLVLARLSSTLLRNDPTPSGVSIESWYCRILISWVRTALYSLPMARKITPNIPMTGHPTNFQAYSIACSPHECKERLGSDCIL